MQQPTNIALLYVPCASEEEAASIATRLLDERLIACANIHATRSLYSWEGQAVDETEFVLVAKTTPDALYMARTRIEQLHSYEVPCVLSTDTVMANAEYGRWVASCVTDNANEAKVSESMGTS